MTRDLVLKSTKKNWIVSINATNIRGEMVSAPVATIPRRPYTAASLAGLVEATKKFFFLDKLIIETDADGLQLLRDLEMIPEIAYREGRTQLSVTA